METIETLTKTQKDLFTKIQKIQINFKKDSLERKTKEYAEARIVQLNNLWSAAIDNNNALEDLKEKNPTHPYFANKSFETLEKLAEEISEQLENTLKDALQRGKNTETLQEQYKMINKQTELINGVTRMITKIEEKIDLEASTAFFTQNSKLLDDYWQRILQNHMEIVSMGKVKDSYFDNKMFEDIEEKYQAMTIKLGEKYIKLQSPGTPKITQAPATPSVIIGTQSAVAKEINVRLPNIEIPNFNGNYLNWKSFRDLFVELIHNNTTLGKTQKLFYLKANLVGEPFELIKHLQVTAENYETAWEILDKRFNNIRTLVEAQVKLLFGLPSVPKESAKAIKKLHDSTSECLLAIKNLGVKTDNWDPLIIYLITQRLDKESHRLYEQSLKSPRELQNLKNLFEFLEGRFQSLEALENKSPQTQGEKHLRAFHGVTRSSCTICKESQKIYNCQKFTAMNQH